MSAFLPLGSFPGARKAGLEIRTIMQAPLSRDRADRGKQAGGLAMWRPLRYNESAWSP
jgi:hypothetical protein